MKKYIKLGDAYIEDNVIKVKIIAQSHRYKEFGNCDERSKHDYDTFKASNGMAISSVHCPANELDNRIIFKAVYMRGTGTDHDKDPITFTSLNDYNKFVEAVKEYNEYFSKPQIKEMTMEELCKELGYEVKIKKED